MNKIGFRIYRFKDGPSVGLTVNEGDWTKKVVDIRDILKLYNYEGESKFAMFMSFSENGAYITIARYISGKGGDNTAAWIYIPNNIEVLGNDIIPIIEVVKEELSAPKSNVERLSRIFAKEYRTIEAADYMPSSTEKVFAKRDVGFYPLKDIIGEKRYQPIYSTYNVVLINDMDGMEVVDKNITDLSSEKMVETLVFCPPVKQNLPNGVTAHFNTSGFPLFNKPVRVKKSEQINLVFKRDGFEDIPYMDSVEENDQICGVPTFDWKISITKDQFDVRAAYNREKVLSDEARIYVNGTELRSDRVIQLSERTAANATVRISANGYESYEQTVNLLNVQSSITVKLHRAERTQTWKIELSNGENAEMTLKSKNLPQRDSGSPLKGYSVGERNDCLEYANTSIKQRAIGFIMAIAAGLVVCLCVALYDWFDCHSFTWQLRWPPLKIEKTSTTTYKPSADANMSGSKDAHQKAGDNSTTIDSSVTTIKYAIAYLDDNDAWVRDSLNKYSDLDHLFEELNTYDIDNILKRESTLRASVRFKNILDAINDNKAKIQANKDKAYGGKYCPENDFTITVSSYIDKLNKPIEQKSQGASDGIAKKAAKNAQSKLPASKHTEQNSKSNASEKKNGNVL